MLGNLELWLIFGGAALLLFAFASSVRGLWPRTYRELPSLSDIRNLAREETTDERASGATRDYAGRMKTFGGQSPRQ